MADPDPERLLDTREMAERLSLSTVTLKRYRERGVGPRWIRLPGGPRGAIRYPESEAVDFMHRDLTSSLAEEFARQGADD